MTAPVTVPSKFLGQHFYKFPTDPDGGAASSAPTYGYGIWRSHADRIFWADIETSDGVFNWSRADAQIDYFFAQGKDVYYQIYYTPAFHATGAWALVPDKDRGKVGGTCPPSLDKLQRFVTALMTRYNTDTVRNNGGQKKIKFISPWNEVKTDGPVVELTYTSIIGSIAVGASGATSSTAQAARVLGHNTSIKKLTVQYDNSIAAGAIPMTVGEQFRIDGSNYITITAFKFLYYYSGSNEQMAAMSRTVYQAAKAVDPSIVVTSPEFVESYDGEPDYIQMWANASDGAGGYGRNWCETLSYHWYNYDALQELTKFGFAYPVAQRFKDLTATMAASGLTGKPLHGSECGYTPGWKFVDAVAEDVNKAAVIKRTAATMAALGCKSFIAFAHEAVFIGDPSTHPTISAALDDINRVLSGATITSFKLQYNGWVRFIANGREYVW